MSSTLTGSTVQTLSFNTRRAVVSMASLYTTAAARSSLLLSVRGVADVLVGAARRQASERFDGRASVMMVSSAKKLLFACSQNKLRSLTAEKLLECSSEYQVRSVGTQPDAQALRVLAALSGFAAILGERLNTISN